MTDVSNVHLTDEQWAFIREQEHRRTGLAIAANRDAANFQTKALEAIGMMLDEQRRSTMTIRDTLAAQYAASIAVGNSAFTYEARTGYQFADALLAEREKGA